MDASSLSLPCLSGFFRTDQIGLQHDISSHHVEKVGNFENFVNVSKRSPSRKQNKKASKTRVERPTPDVSSVPLGGLTGRMEGGQKRGKKGENERGKEGVKEGKKVFLRDSRICYCKIRRIYIRPGRTKKRFLH